MSRLLVLTPGELTRDPRARRAALTALARGYEVVGLCAQVTGDRPSELAGVSIVRVGGDRLSGALRSRGLGGMRASSPVIRELRGLWRLARLVRTTTRLTVGSRRLGRFDVVHANDFDTLPAAWLIARDGGRLVYDSHEIYTSQEPDPPRVFNAVVGAVEGALARRAACVVTTGQPLADELRRRLRLPRNPAIVLNCPEREPTEPPSPREGGPLRVIYQAAMGPGRPLTDVIAAAAHAEGTEITLRVLGADEASLQRLIDTEGVADRVLLAEPVPPDRLESGLHGFHAGLIINRPITKTDELVVPNKLFEYMMAGLAVIAPRLPGLAPIVEGEEIGVTFEPGDTKSLGSALAALALRRSELPAMRARARLAALEHYNAEAQAEALALAWSG